MESDFKDNLFTWIARALCFGIVVVGSCFLYPTYLRRQTLHQREVDCDRRIAEKREEIRKLSENQRRFRTDPDFVEMIARQNRRVFPGELVFVFEGK